MKTKALKLRIKAENAWTEHYQKQKAQIDRIANGDPMAFHLIKSQWKYNWLIEEQCKD